MMRAGDRAGVAVRRPDGDIETRMLDVPGWARRAEATPFVRGLAGLGESLVLGVEALRWSEGAAGFRPSDKRPAPMWPPLSISLVAGIFLIDRKSVVEGKSVSIRVEFGGRRIV